MRRILRHLVLVCAALGAAPHSTAAPSVGAALSFVRFTPDGPRTFVVGAERGPAAALFADGRQAAETAWSPDGRYVAYTSSTGAGASSLQVADVGTGNRRTVVRQAPTARRTLISNPAWSPDGQYILYTRLEQPFRYELYAVPSSGGKPRKITDGHFGVWAPDGRRLAFVWRRDPSQPARIYVARADGSERKLVAERATEPTWSPDGRRLAFVRTHGHQMDLYVTNTTGTHERRLTRNAAHDLNPAWSPDGDSIAFSSNRSGSFDIYVMDLVDSRIRRLTSEASDEQEPAWRPLPR